MATALDDIDLDEEIRRQRAMEALLAPPEAQTQAESDQQPDSAKQDDTPPKKVEDVYGDWRKWPSLSPEEAADIPTIEQQPVPAGHIDLAPPGHIDLAPPTAPPAPTPPAGLQTDPDTGQRYVTDPSGQMVPYAEPATEADKQAFKPGDVTLPQVTTEAAAPVQPAPDKLDQVERATLVKLPSQVPPAPGKLTQVERALPAGPKAPGAHTELAPPGQMDLRADTDVVPPPAAQPAQPAAQPTPAQPAVTPTTQPAVTADPNNWKTWTTTDGTVADPQAVQAVQPASAGTLKAGEGNRVDPTQLYSYLVGKFANSSLVGYVPPDGARWGIKTGSAAEWAAFGLAVAKQESGFNTKSYNAADPGGSAGLFQFGQGQTQFTNGKDQFDPQASADAFVRSVEHYVGNKGNVANLGETFGSIRRPNEAGQYIPYAQEVAAKAPAQGETALPPQKQDWESWATLSPEDQAKVDAQVQAKQQSETAAISQLPEAQNSNIIGLYKRLDSGPIPGVSDATRTQTQAKLKTEIIAQMRAKFPEIKTDDEAWSEAQKDTGPLEVAKDWGSKVMGYVQQFTDPMKVGAANTDQFSIDQFLNKAMPNASDADKHAYLTKLYGMSLDQRASEIAGRLGPGFVQPGNPYRDPYFLAQALDRLSDPNFQKRQADDVANFQAEMKRNVSDDPRLADTPMNRVVNDTAQIPAAIAAFSNPTMWPMALAQVHDQVMDGFKKEHPEWDDKTLQEKSTYATLAQFFGGLVAGHVMSAGAGALMEGIEGKAQRAIAQAVFGGTSQAAIGGLTQVGTNIIAGDPLSKGTGEATLSGLIQGTTTGVGHGVGELAAPRPEVVPEVKPTEPEPAKPVTPPEPPPKPVTRADVLGPEEPTPPAPASPWYMQGADPGQDPLVIRGAERTTFTPQELADLVNRAPSDSTSAELRSFIEQMQSPTGLHLGEEQGIKQAQAVQAIPRPLNVAEAIRQAKADAVAASLGGTPRVVGDPMPKPPVPAPQTATGLKDVGQMGGAISKNMRDMLWNKFQTGDTTEAGGPSNLMRLAAREKAAGRVVTRSDFEDFVNRYGEHLKTGKPIQEFANSEAARTPGAPPPVPSPVEKPFVPQGAAAAPEPPVHVNESEPFVSKIANRYTAERMATGELGHVDPSQGKSTEELIAHGLKMSPESRERMIDNFTRGVGGDLDNQGAAIRSKEALLSIQSTEAGRAAEANPANQQLKAEAEAALKAVTDFHNGPVKKFKRVWSDAGRGLQREIPLDFTTLNGMKEAYLKGKGNGKEVPAELEPKLKQTATRMREAASDEQVAINNWGKDIEKQTRGKTVPSDDSIRARLMEIMGDLPCRN